MSRNPLYCVGGRKQGYRLRVLWTTIYKVIGQVLLWRPLKMFEILDIFADNFVSSGALKNKYYATQNDWKVVRYKKIVYRS